MASFADRLTSAIVAKQTPAMVGIDPQWDLLPESERQAGVFEHGETLAAAASAYRQFCRTVLETVAPLVPVVKFQAAFFEAVGPLGLNVLAELIQYARSLDLVVVLDGKRNDIGSTAAAYANGYLGAFSLSSRQLPVWGADALTVNPYLGAEGIEPFLKSCREHGAGVFVLVRTSNPGAGLLQDLSTGSKRVYEVVADWVSEWSERDRRGERFGPVGAVVGATVPAQLGELRRRMPHSLLLVPGYGAQGGTAADVAGAFDEDGLGAVVNNSRGILYAYREPAFVGMNWPDAVRAATESMICALAAATPAGRLRR